MRGQGGDEGLHVLLLGPPSDGENAAVDVIAGDRVENRLARDIDGNLVRDPREQIGEAVHPIFKEQERFRPKPGLREKDVENDPSLRDEAAFPADEIPLPDLPVGREPRIVRSVYANDLRHGAAGSGRNVALVGSCCRRS